MKTEELDKIDIIGDTVKKFVNEIWKDTSESKKWQKNCPKCGGIQIYKNRNQLLKAVRNKTICKSCKITKQKLWMFSRRWKEQFVDHSKDVHKKECPRCGREQFYKNKRHLLRCITRNTVCRDCQLIIRKPTSIGNPNYNPNACKYFDELNKKNGWNLQHALNGGEIKIHRYWVDAYDKERNIVVEYDEHQHYKNTGELLPYDIKRMHTIMNLLKCKFYRYNEMKNLLYDVNIGQVAVV